MRPSKSLKVLNKSKGSVSHLQHSFKKAQTKNTRLKGNKKVKRNSTGNMQMRLQQTSLKKNKEKDYDDNDRIFHQIQISKCEPIPQIQTPTLVDKNTDYHITKQNQQKINLEKKWRNYMQKSEKQKIQVILKTPKNSSVADYEKDNIPTNHHKIQSNRRAFVNEISSYEIKKSQFLEGLTKYIFNLSKISTSDSNERIEEYRNNRNAQSKINFLHDQAQKCRIYQKKIKQAEKVLYHYHAENLQQKKMIINAQQRKEDIEKQLYFLYQQLKQKKKLVKYQRLRKEQLQLKLKQYQSHFLKERIKSNRKMQNIYRHYPEDNELNEAYEEQLRHLQQSRRYVPQKTHINGQRKRYTHNQIQKLLNYSYDSDEDIQ